MLSLFYGEFLDPRTENLETALSRSYLLGSRGLFTRDLHTIK